MELPMKEKYPAEQKHLKDRDKYSTYVGRPNIETARLTERRAEWQGDRESFRAGIDSLISKWKE